MIKKLLIIICLWKHKPLENLSTTEKECVVRRVISGLEI